MILTVFMVDPIWSGKNKGLRIQEYELRRLAWYQEKSSKAGIYAALNLLKCSGRSFYNLDLCFLIHERMCYDLSQKLWCNNVSEFKTLHLLSQAL